MSGPRVWVDENDLRLVLRMVERGEFRTGDMWEALSRVKRALDPPASPPLRPWRANMQGYGA